MEYAAKAYKYSQEAHQESGSAFREAGKTARSESVKRASSFGKLSKKKG
jgi:hypothetical protein